MQEIERTRNLHVLAIVLAGVGILFTVAVVGLSVGLPAYNQARQTSSEQFAEQLEFRVRVLEEFLSLAQSAAVHLSSHGLEIRELLSAVNGTGWGTSTRLHRDLASHLELVAKTRLIALVRLDTWGNVEYAAGDSLNIEELTRIVKANPGERIIAPVTLAGKRLFVIQEPVFDDAGVPRAKDLLVFPLDRLRESIAAEASDYVEDRLIIATRVGRHILPIHKPLEMPHLDYSGSLTEGLERAFDGDTGTLQGTIGERDVVVAYQPLKGAPWVAAAVADQRVIFAGANRQVLNMTLVASVLLFGGGGVTLWLMRLVGRRMVIQAEHLGALAQEHGILLEHSGDMVYRQDLNQRFTFISPAIQAVTGYSVAEWLTGFPGYHTDNPVNDEARRLTEQTLVTGDDPPSYEVEVFHKLGHRVTLEVNERAIREDGRVVGIIGVARDITARRQAEEALAKSAVEWTHAMEFVEEAVCLLDLAGRVVRANRVFFELFTVKADDVLGASFQTTICPGIDPGNCIINRALDRGRDDLTILEPENPNNPTGRPLEVSLRFVRSREDAVEGVVLTIRDLTRLRDTEGELRIAASVFDSSLDGVVIVDVRRRIMKVNPAFTEITGYQHDDVVGGAPAILFSGDLGPNTYREVWSRLRREGLWRGELPVIRKDGAAIATWWNISTVCNEAGTPNLYIATFADVTAKKASEKRIHHLANYDAVTNLPNRMLLSDRLNHAMERARRGGDQVALLFLDLDHFKNINDSLGHAAGDALLREVSVRIRHQVREQDTVARLGGDEFTVVLEGIKEAYEAGIVAEKMLETLSRPYVVDGHEVFASGSIGIAMYPSDGGDAQTLLKNADTAMYRSKEIGRNAFRFYTAEMTAHARERLSLEVALRYAITNQEFSLNYQPQVDSRTGEVVGAEALLRWNHERFGLVSPERFIPLAEDSRQIQPIGKWVLETACSQFQAWKESGRAPQRIAVNLSARQLEDRSFVDYLLNVLERTRLDPASLEIEITESLLMENRSRVVGLLEEISNAGVQIAVDDFGTGYSSLGYLKRFPIDRIKIDRSFVRDIPSDHDDEAIATAIIAMSHSLGLNVIAEGVETQEQLEFLRRAGCREIQGFYCSRPLSGEDFEAFLATRFTALRPKLGLAV